MNRRIFKRPLSAALFIAFFSCFLFPHSLAAVVYVDPNADPGGFMDGTLGAPFNTIQLGVNNAGAAGTVILKPGTYTGLGNWGITFPASNITITSLAGPWNTVVDHPTLIEVANIFSITTSARIDGITIKNARFEAIMITAAANVVKISNCRFIKNSDSTGGGAIKAASSTSVEITDSVFIENSYGAIQIEGGSFVTILRCRFERNWAAGLMLGGGIRIIFSQVTIEDCIFISNTMAIWMASGNIWYRRNSFYNNTGGLALNDIQCNPWAYESTDNLFCGPSASIQKGTVVEVQFNSMHDSCGLCNGLLTEKNCLGVCWGETPASCPAPTVWWVSPDGTGNGTSRDWPLGSISAGINAASNRDVVIVLNGTYTGASNLLLGFGGKAITLKSEFSDPDDVTIDCQTNPTSAFKIQNGESFDTIIDGFTLSECRAGAILVQSTSAATVKNTVIRQASRTSGPGGAIHLQNSFISLENVRVENSFSTVWNGGAIGMTRNSPLTSGVHIKNSKFTQNSAVKGGAIAIDSGCSALVTDSFFNGNTGNDGGAIHLATGSRLDIKRSSFNGNGCPYNTLGVKAVLCEGTIQVKEDSSNTFCNTTETYINCPTYFTGATLTLPDACGVCNGPNVELCP